MNFHQMNNKIIFKEVGIIFLLFLVFSCKTKNEIADVKTIEDVNYIPYYLKVYEADSLFIIGDYERSHGILDSLFKKFEPIEIQGYYEYSNYVFAAVLTGKTENIKKIAKKAYTDNGGLNSQQLKIVNKLDSIERIIGFSEKEKNVFIASYNGKINKELRKLVDKTLKEDQSVRAENFKTVEELGEMAKAHEPVIKGIFDKYGYPSTKKIGFGDNLVAVFMHADLGFKENYLLPKLLDYIKKGEDTPDAYTNTYDKWHLHKTGNYYYSNNSSILQGKELDSARESIGLPHKNYVRWRNKMIYDEYKKYESK